MVKFTASHNHLLGKLFAAGSGMKAQVAKGSQRVLFVWAGTFVFKGIVFLP